MLQNLLSLYNEILDKTPDTYSRRRKLELIFAITALVGFFLHLAAITLAQTGLVTNSYLAEQNIISAITTPFTVILIYEVILLVISFKRPIIHSLLIQFEVISLIFLRDTFKVFSEYQNLVNGGFRPLTEDIVLTLIISFALFAVVRFMQWLMERDHSLCEQETHVVQKVKKLLTAFLLGGLLVLFVDYLAQFTPAEFLVYVGDGFPLTDFFVGVFTMMIIADVLQFVLTFIEKQTYAQLFRIAAFLISAILIRSALTVPHPQDLILVVVSLVTALGITLMSVEWRSVFTPTKL